MSKRYYLFIFKALSYNTRFTAEEVSNILPSSAVTDDATAHHDFKQMVHELRG